MTTRIAIALIACLLVAPLAAAEREYSLLIEADFRAAEGQDCVPVRVRVSQERHLLRELSWSDRDSMRSLKAEGDLTEADGRHQWSLPEKGGTLEYCLVVDEKSGDSYVARHQDDWVLMRADDLFPPVRARSLKNAQSTTTLRFILPEGWTSATRYSQSGRDDQYQVTDPDRQLDRPTGWLALGRIGVRRDLIAGIRVVVASPMDQDVRRMDVMAMLGYTLPSFVSWFARSPQRLLVVSARDDMWRGALSGPASLYLHAERPMVSENGTSPLMHELVHVFMQRMAVSSEDWIDEGLAEYLGLLMLKESGGITQHRFEDALAWQARWAEQADGLGQKNSTGPETALAVGIFAGLHDEMGLRGFRQLVRELSAPGPKLTGKRLRQAAETIHGGPLASLPQD